MDMDWLIQESILNEDVTTRKSSSIGDRKFYGRSANLIQTDFGKATASYSGFYFHSRRVPVGEYFTIVVDNNTVEYARILTLVELPNQEEMDFALKLQLMTECGRDVLDCPILADGKICWLRFNQIQLMKYVHVIPHPIRPGSLLHNLYIKKEIGGTSATVYNQEQPDLESDSEEAEDLEEAEEEVYVED